MKVRVVIADSCCVVRRGLRALLHNRDGIGIVAEGKNGEEAVRLSLKHEPDVVMLEVTMPGMDGIQATKAILTRQPDARIVALSVRSDASALEQMFEAGAVGFLVKDADAEEIVFAVKTVFGGEIYIGKSMGQIFSKKTILARFGKNRKKHYLNGLTRREREIYDLSHQGLYAKEIAAKLGVTIRTVEAYRRQIRAKASPGDTCVN